MVWFWRFGCGSAREGAAAAAAWFVEAYAARLSLRWGMYRGRICGGGRRLDEALCEVMGVGYEGVTCRLGFMVR